MQRHVCVCKQNSYRHKNKINLKRNLFQRLSETWLCSYLAWVLNVFVICVVSRKFFNDPQGQVPCGSGKECHPSSSASTTCCCANYKLFICLVFILRSRLRGEKNQKLNRTLTGQYWTNASKTLSRVKLTLKKRKDKYKNLTLGVSLGLWWYIPGVTGHIPAVSRSPPEGKPAVTHKALLWKETITLLFQQVGRWLAAIWTQHLSIFQNKRALPGETGKGTTPLILQEYFLGFVTSK